MSGGGLGGSSVGCLRAVLIGQNRRSLPYLPITTRHRVSALPGGGSGQASATAVSTQSSAFPHLSGAEEMLDGRRGPCALPLVTRASHLRPSLAFPKPTLMQRAVSHPPLSLSKPPRTRPSPSFLPTSTNISHRSADHPPPINLPTYKTQQASPTLNSD